MTELKSRVLKELTAALLIAGFFAVVIATPVSAGDCGGVKTALEYGCSDANPIYGLAKSLMQLLAALVAVAIVGAMIVGGIGYASAADDKGQIAKSISIIRNAIIALLLFIGMGAILNALIPGGVV